MLQPQMISVGAFRVNQLDLSCDLVRDACCPVIRAPLGTFDRNWLSCSGFHLGCYPIRLECRTQAEVYLDTVSFLVDILEVSHRL